MYNPSRRNRNIGTGKQGHKTQSTFQIPSSWKDGLAFYEKLGPTTCITREIGGQLIRFLVEQSYPDSPHACSVEDLVHLLAHIPETYYKGLTTFVLRQPKAKEEILAPVWGRLVYAFEFDKITTPAVVLESVNYTRNIVWDRKLSLGKQQELARLQEDGFEIAADKRRYVIKPDPDAVRRTQLYRTLLHEIGHYYQFISMDAAKHDNLITAEKEVFAHDFAEKRRRELVLSGQIPFARLGL